VVRNEWTELKIELLKDFYIPVTVRLHSLPRFLVASYTVKPQIAVRLLLLLAKF
jgi:hypothetical protein